MPIPRIHVTSKVEIPTKLYKRVHGTHSTEEAWNLVLFYVLKPLVQSICQQPIDSEQPVCWYIDQFLANCILMLH